MDGSPISKLETLHIVNTLEIEYGRRRNITVEERICKHCTMNNNIEDESHFVLKCPLYVNKRNYMYHKIIKECKYFGNMSDQNKFV